ncbi:Hsp70 family protein [Nocardia sp. NBC_00881]|uniref:Hsp70 family protein n=1 Tax=Nocardia sp. NBC_00881 TaxID=2975995 RepID=UPI003866D77E|nr:Hsp70 family protein [Nocardia sp. NBC_00881]
MAVGLGLSIGTVNTVSALAEEGSAKAPPGPRKKLRPQAITRRTTLTFYSTGVARVGMIPRHGRAITEFADLTQRSTTRARVGRRTLSPANLVATVADCVIREVLHDHPSRGAGVGIALTHPARYTDEQVGELRAALDGADLTQVALVAEPIAAATWLEADRGPLMPGLALVYDLGGAGLDVTLVRVGVGRPRNPIVGESLRSTEFGGRAFGARCAERAGHGLPSSSITESVADADELRSAHIKKSLELVYRCLRTADVTMADVDRVLVVGGAARPVEVARVLADELARPVITAPDPERTIADGAAIIGRRAAAEAEAAAEPPADQRRGGRRGGAGRPAATRALLLSRRTKRRLARGVVVAALSLAGIGLSVVPSDGVIVGLSQLGLR